MSMQQLLLEQGIQVVPGSATYGAGSNAITIPLYNNLTVELWGAGASAGTIYTVSPQPTVFKAGVNGGDTYISAFSMTAHGGSAPTAASPNTAQGGGTASGGTTNTTGGVSTVGVAYIWGGIYVLDAGGGGGNGANGGTGGAAQAQVNYSGARPGANGSGLGAGGGGPSAAFTGSPAYHNSTAGGSGGGYCSLSYTRASGPPWKTVISFVVGARGIAPAGFSAGGNGTDGQIKFTWN